MTQQRLGLELPPTFQIPDIYVSGSSPDICMALSLGAQAFDTLRSKAIEQVRNETHSDAVKEATEAVRLVADTQAKKLRAEKAGFEEALSVAKARIEALEQQAALVRAAAVKEAKESSADLVAAKDRMIKELNQRLESTLQGLVGRVEGLQNSITKTFSSSKEKGSYGETLMEGLIKKAFDCDVRAVSKDANTADIKMIREGGLEYFWEVKNYTRMVSTEEVEKLRRDLRLHPEVRGGVLVSLRTGIVGHTRGGDIDLEFLEDGRAILYLSNFMSRDDPVFYLQSLRPFFQLLESTVKPLKGDSETVRALEAKAALIANLLRSHATSVAKHRNSLVAHQKRMDLMFAEFKGYITESEAQLQSLLRVAVGTEEDVGVVTAEAETFLSPLVFVKERLSDIEGRTKSFVNWLIGETETREGVQLRVKDLLDKAKERGFGEKFVRELREDVFQGSAWSSRSQYILGLRWRCDE